MNNKFVSIFFALAMLLLAVACEDAIYPDEEIDQLETASNYVRFDDEDPVDAEFSDTTGTSVTLTVESLPINDDPIEVSYEISGVPAIDGSATVTLDKYTPDVDFMISIPANALGSDATLIPVLDTTFIGASDTIDFVTATYVDQATATLTGVSGGLTLGRGTNSNALGEELDPVSVIINLTQVEIVD